MDMCIECNRIVTGRQQALECDYCNQWQHRICGTGLTLKVIYGSNGLRKISLRLRTYQYLEWRYVQSDRCLRENSVRRVRAGSKSVSHRLLIL